MKKKVEVHVSCKYNLVYCVNCRCGGHPLPGVNSGFYPNDWFCPSLVVFANL